MPTTYRKAEISDIDAITKLSMFLYNGNYTKNTHEYDELYKSNQDDLINPHMAMFLAFDHDDAIGFAHASLRYDYVEGTEGGNVGYLEGIYVTPGFRGNGIAKELVSMCENWSKEKGCAEFASDCELENTDSLAFHLKIGFTEANRIICFAKKL